MTDVETIGPTYSCHTCHTKFEGKIPAECPNCSCTGLTEHWNLNIKLDTAIEFIPIDIKLLRES